MLESNRFSLVVLNETQGQLEAIHELDLPNLDSKYLQANCPLLQSEYKKSVAYLYPNQGTILPQFEESNLEKLSSFQMEKTDEHKFHFSNLASTGLSLTSLMLKEEHDFLAKSFKFIAVESLACSFILSNRMQSKLNRNIHLAWHISPESSLLGVFNSGEILFYNQFKLSNTEDLLYYSLNVMDELKIPTRETLVLLSGRVQSISPQNGLLSEFLRHWKYTDHIEGLPLNYINEAARIRNYTLLNSFRCA